MAFFIERRRGKQDRLSDWVLCRGWKGKGAWALHRDWPLPEKEEEG